MNVNFTFQVREVRQELVKRGVFKDLTELALPLTINTLAVNENSIYTYTKRVTTAHLMDKIAKQLIDIEIDFKEKTEKTVTEFLSNYMHCKRSDTILGADDINDSNDEACDDIVIGKDGTHKLSCPMQHCSTRTFKIRRHLSDTHSDLTSKQIEYATNMAKIMERNKETMNWLTTKMVTTKISYAMHQLFQSVT